MFIFSFWSYVLHDKEFLNPLLHFLQESTPFYIPLKELFNDNDAVVKLYEKICKNALVIVCRLITNRESDEEFMPKEKHAEILYGNFLISVPMLFDLISLYGHSNKDIVQKIFTTIIKIEPKYANDIKAGIKFILDTIPSLKERLQLIEKENRDLYEKYEDLSLYLMNIAVTLNLILEFIPVDLKIYCTRDLHIHKKIVGLYEWFIPTLYQNSHDVDPSAWFLIYINFARIEIINCFRTILNRPILAIFNAGEKNRNKIADEILSIFLECADYKSFIDDYVKLYPFEIDLDVITQCGKKM